MERALLSHLAGGTAMFAVIGSAWSQAPATPLPPEVPTSGNPIAAQASGFAIAKLLGEYGVPLAGNAGSIAAKPPS